MSAVTTGRVRIAGFFALAGQAVPMSTLRQALARLPGAAFADLLEADEAYLVVIDLPGATAETTDLFVEGNRIRIEARRAKEVPDRFRFVREDRPLFLDVELPLPPDASGDGASASLDNGVLELRLPKRAAAGGHRIEIE